MTLTMDGSFLAQTGRLQPRLAGLGLFDDVRSDPPRNELVLEVKGDGAPNWLKEVVRRLNVAVAVAATEPGWRPMTDTAVISSLRALRRVMTVDSVRPSVTPTPEGGLQFEWHEAGWDVEIEVEPDGSVETWGHHLHNGATFHGPMSAAAENLRVALKEITLHHLVGND
jgi:hypothetical protein